MIELKARHSLPPQPNLLSRIPALSSRELKTPEHISPKLNSRLEKLALLTTERFRTGYEGTLNAVKKELLDIVEPTVPNERLFSTPNEPTTVAIASGNDTKIKEFIRVVSEHANVINIPEAEETHTLSTLHDALSKGISAAEIISQSEDTSRREVKNRHHLTIATDALNKIPTKKIDDTTGLTQITYQPLGKPNNLRNKEDAPLSREEQEKSVQLMFGNLAKMAKENNWETIPYVTESTTIMYNPKDPKNYSHSTQKSSIFLSPTGVTHLATDEGFMEYKEKAKELGFDITKTAGGFELDALDQLGYVKYITGTASDIEKRINLKKFPDQRENAKEHAYAIAKGSVDAKLVGKYFENNNTGDETVEFIPQSTQNVFFQSLQV
ncbi:MAG TPA: hypothetical protein VF189_05870 [Patescibacteria group bacterium]